MLCTNSQVGEASAWLGYKPNWKSVSKRTQQASTLLLRGWLTNVTAMTGLVLEGVRGRLEWWIKSIPSFGEEVDLLAEREVYRALGQLMSRRRPAMTYEE